MTHPVHDGAEMTLTLTPPATVSPPRTAYLTRHGSMRFIGEYVGLPGQMFQRGEKVVLRTERGQEVGDVLCPSTPQVLAGTDRPAEIRRFSWCAPPARFRHDLRWLWYDKGQELVNSHHLAMQIVDVEHLFGGERILFYFLAETRVDFRELVKSMAREFRARIELRQIGVRDEAKLLADYGDCGKPVCCNTHMIVMPPVSMRMAKLQKSTLDPNKISGRCGRLKCCLRFEQDVYEEFVLELPAVGSKVVTKAGPGRVLAQEILARRVLVEFEDGRRLPVPAADVLTRL